MAGQVLIVLLGVGARGGQSSEVAAGGGREGFVRLELDLEGEGGAGEIWLGRKGRKDAFLCLPCPQTDLRSLDNCLANAWHIKEQVSQCGWLSANPLISTPGDRKWLAQTRSPGSPACMDKNKTQRVDRLPCHPS